MLLIEKKLLEKFIDNCIPATRYYNFSNNDILTAFVWSEADKFDIYIYNVSTELRMKEILGRV